MRRLGAILPGLSRKIPERKPYPPGEHGPRRHRRRISEYGIHLNEKQKLRHHYGLTESQFRNYVERASSMAGASPSEKLARLLELRLDNIVFRLGFAPTIPAARQLVRHGHIRAGGRKVDIPSYHVSKGETISVAEESRAHPRVMEGVQHGGSLLLPGYLQRETGAFEGRCVDMPRLDDIPVEFDERLVIEFYATK